MLRILAYALPMLIHQLTERPRQRHYEVREVSPGPGMIRFARDRPLMRGNDRSGRTKSKGAIGLLSATS